MSALLVWPVGYKQKGAKYGLDKETIDDPADIDVWPSPQSFNIPQLRQSSRRATAIIIFFFLCERAVCVRCKGEEKPPTPRLEPFFENRSSSIQPGIEIARRHVLRQAESANAKQKWKRAEINL